MSCFFLLLFFLNVDYERWDSSYLGEDAVFDVRSERQHIGVV